MLGLCSLAARIQNHFYRYACKCLAAAALSLPTKFMVHSVICVTLSWHAALLEFVTLWPNSLPEVAAHSRLLALFIYLQNLTWPSRQILQVNEYSSSSMDIYRSN